MHAADVGSTIAGLGNTLRLPAQGPGAVAHEIRQQGADLAWRGYRSCSPVVGNTSYDMFSARFPFTFPCLTADCLTSSLGSQMMGRCRPRSLFGRWCRSEGETREGNSLQEST